VKKLNKEETTMVIVNVCPIATERTSKGETSLLVTNLLTYSIYSIFPQQRYTNLLFADSYVIYF